MGGVKLPILFTKQIPVCFTYPPGIYIRNIDIIYKQN